MMKMMKMIVLLVIMTRLDDDNDVLQARIQDFLKGGGGDGHKGGGWSGVIAPVGEKLLFEHTKFSATKGGWSPLPHTPPVSATVLTMMVMMIIMTMKIIMIVGLLMLKMPMRKIIISVDNDGDDDDNDNQNSLDNGHESPKFWEMCATFARTYKMKGACKFLACK